VDTDPILIPTGDILANQPQSVNDFWTAPKQIGANFSNPDLLGNCGQGCLGYGLFSFFLLFLFYFLVFGVWLKRIRYLEFMWKWNKLTKETRHLLPNKPPSPLQLARPPRRPPPFRLVRHPNRGVHRPRSLPNLLLWRTKRYRGPQIHTRALRRSRSAESH